MRRRRTASAAAIPGSVGRVMADTELRVIDPVSGADLGAGERGELLVRGPAGHGGLPGRPAATAADPGPATAGCAPATSARSTRDGNVFVVERLKELIKVNAHQVAPAELEGLSQPTRRSHDAAVSPGRTRERGEIPVAVVVPRGELDAEELDGLGRRARLTLQAPRAVRFAASIPRTPSGKVLRRLLAEEERTPV